MKWSRDKKSGIYTSDNKRWKISIIDKKWVLQDTKSKKTYKDNTLKALQAKALELEKSETPNTKVTISKSMVKKVDEQVVVKEEVKEPQVELFVSNEVTPTVTISEVKDSFVGKRVDAKPSKKHLASGLGNFVPVEGRVLS